MPNKRLLSHHLTDLRTCFFGTPRFAQIVLEKLIDSPYKPQLVITASDKPAGRGQKVQPSPVQQTATKNNIEALQPESLSDKNFKFHFPKGNETISNFKFQIAILVAYSKIIPKEILAIPKYGFVNVHPSLLPKYRGPSPIQSALLAGEEKTGVTIMLLDEKIDHGPILAQKEIEIEKTDTHESLIVKLGNLGADLLIGILPQYIFHLRGEKTRHLEGVLKDAKIFLPPKPQNHSKATYTKIIKKSDGFIDLASLPDPQTFDRLVRAFYPWPGVYTKLKLKNEKVKIFKFLPPTIPLSYHPTDPFVIQPEGKRPMTIKEFLNGYPKAKKLIEKLLRPQQ